MNILKEKRLEAALTQEELAKKSGISRVTIALLETGNLTTAKSSTILALAKALNIDVGELLRPEN